MSTRHKAGEALSGLVTLDSKGVPTTTSLIIADGTKIQHKNVLGLIRTYLSDLEKFGMVAFETPNSAFEMRNRSKRGRPTEFVILNEAQATLLLTLMRNSPVVVAFKVALVQAFCMLARQAAVAPSASVLFGLTLPELPPEPPMTGSPQQKALQAWVLEILDAIQATQHVIKEHAFHILREEAQRNPALLEILRWANPRRGKNRIVGSRTIQRWRRDLFGGRPTKPTLSAAPTASFVRPSLETLTATMRAALEAYGPGAAEALHAIGPIFPDPAELGGAR